MIRSPETGGDADEAAGNRVPDPHTQPALPPRQSASYSSRRYHPGVDVEGIGNPEPDEIPWTPLATLKFDCKAGQSHSTAWLHQSKVSTPGFKS